MVHGAKPERWVRQTNFDNEEAVGYLADRLARLGIEEALAKAGAEPGCLVRIGAFEFDWQPTVYAGKRVHPRPARLGLPAQEDENRPPRPSAWPPGRPGASRTSSSPPRAGRPTAPARYRRRGNSAGNSRTD